AVGAFEIGDREIDRLRRRVGHAVRGRHVDEAEDEVATVEVMPPAVHAPAGIAEQLGVEASRALDVGHLEQNAEDARRRHALTGSLRRTAVDSANPRKATAVSHPPSANWSER